MTIAECDMVRRMKELLIESNKLNRDMLFDFVDSSDLVTHERVKHLNGRIAPVVEEVGLSLYRSEVANQNG